ncbi:hypothetical protein IFM89_015732 [Coptis chinensis]|uniref:Uncharacterized protein n=1 Tax=Coptis chinensis TaxID=261450 RepID=A0A835I171_9MAGN|nr:hypothetical protein IFM89_015732 [Coptis chinensis]
MKSISFYFPLIYGTEHSPEKITEVSDILTSLYNEYATRSSMPSQPSSWNTKTSSKASGSKRDIGANASKTSRTKLRRFEAFLEDSSVDVDLKSALDGDKYAFEIVDKAIDEFEINEDCGDIVEPEPDPRTRSSLPQVVAPPSVKNFITSQLLNQLAKAMASLDTDVNMLPVEVKLEGGGSTGGVLDHLQKSMGLSSATHTEQPELNLHTKL